MGPDGIINARGPRRICCRGNQVSVAGGGAVDSSGINVITACALTERLVVNGAFSAEPLLMTYSIISPLLVGRSSEYPAPGVISATPLNALSPTKKPVPVNPVVAQTWDVLIASSIASVVTEALLSQPESSYAWPRCVEVPSEHTAVTLPANPVTLRFRNMYSLLVSSA